MYAASIATDNNNHLFYWLFEKPQEMPTLVPLVMIMNGGPGFSSLNSLFTETGPLRVSQKDPMNQDSYEISYVPAQSWQSLGDLLYVEHPVGTGWSSPSDLSEMALEFLQFLNNFYKEFPERKKQELVLTGEGYAG